jgi:hypothetical protein
MRIHVLVAMLFVTSSAILAGALSVNGVCEFGVCASPDVLALGQSTFNSFYGGIVLANSDRYVIDWTNLGTNFSGTLGSLYPGLQIGYLGNLSNGPTAADVITVDFLQGVASSLTSESHTYGRSGFFGGSLAAGSSIEALFLIDGMLQSTEGPFFSSTSFWSGTSSGTVSGLSDPLIYDDRYVFTVAAGSMPGAGVNSGSLTLFIPEPGSFILAAAGLAVAAAFRKRLR